MARRVLPDPPGPVIVTTADEQTSEETSACSISRPMKLLGGEGRLLERRGAWVGPGDPKSPASCFASAVRPLQRRRRLEPEIFETSATTVISSDRQLALALGAYAPIKAVAASSEAGSWENTASQASMTLSAPEAPWPVERSPARAMRAA